MRVRVSEVAFSQVRIMRGSSSPVPLAAALEIQQEGQDWGSRQLLLHDYCQITISAERDGIQRAEFAGCFG